MPVLSIIITEKLKSFLERYYNTKTLEERFYDAIAENLVIQKGKGFCLTFEAQTELDNQTQRERTLAESDHLANMHQSTDYV